MRLFNCRCGKTVFFDNHSCTHCGRELAFDCATLRMVSEEEPGAGLAFCANRTEQSRCNWLADGESHCLSCRITRVIPTLSKPENGERWRKLEVAKRQLLYDVMRLGLPVDERRLHFVFKEDRSTNPDVDDDHVLIGHREGTITINAAEADEVYREQMRQAVNEPVRTLLGHFRHESGHYYHGIVVDETLADEARSVFGDERSDYDAALGRYYAEGPVPGWEDSFISGYASAHPLEDWAECWSHYLNIRAVLEAAESTGLSGPPLPDAWPSEFVELMVSVNEVLRSLGQPDAYPFVITEGIANKIDFVHRAVARYVAA